MNGYDTPRPRREEYTGWIKMTPVKLDIFSLYQREIHQLLVWENERLLWKWKGRSFFQAPRSKRLVRPWWSLLINSFGLRFLRFRRHDQRSTCTYPFRENRVPIPILFRRSNLCRDLKIFICYYFLINQYYISKYVSKDCNTFLDRISFSPFNRQVVRGESKRGGNRHVSFRVRSWNNTKEG